MSDDNEGQASERRRRQGASYSDEDERVLGFFWFGFGTKAFFFFFDKHSIGVCIAFALYRLYWGLVFSAFSASDVIVGTGF